jgi:hypothetical protein
MNTQGIALEPSSHNAHRADGERPNGDDAVPRPRPAWPRESTPAGGNARPGRGACAPRSRSARRRGPSRRRRCRRTVRRRYRRLAPAQACGLRGIPQAARRPSALGPEIVPEGLPEFYERLQQQLPGCVAEPLWLRGRVTGLLLCVGTPIASLADIAKRGAAALELATDYTDHIEAARRKPTTPAAEIQQQLLPPPHRADRRRATSRLPASHVRGPRRLVRFRRELGRARRSCSPRKEASGLVRPSLFARSCLRPNSAVRLRRTVPAA